MHLPQKFGDLEFKIDECQFISGEDVRFFSRKLNVKYKDNKSCKPLCTEN